MGLQPRGDRPIPIYTTPSPPDTHSFIHGKDVAGVNDQSASNLIITLTEVEYEEGPGLGLFSCHGGVFGACYPEVCVCRCRWVGFEGRKGGKGGKGGRFEPHADQPLSPVPRTLVSQSQDVTFEGGPGGSHVDKPVKYAVGVW